jgi:thioester reductase-like protein
MESPTFFFTGFPGFLGSETLPQVLALVPGSRAILLVQPHFVQASERKVAELGLTDRVELAIGDLLKQDLGLGATDLQRLQGAITQIFHFAAVYDLGVQKDLAYSINVDGTRRMIEFARGCPHLERFHYVSTCYVSGRHAGPFREADLELGQAFNNYYEETNYHAEVEVQKARASGLPAVIYRPSIVVGNSRTGATQKYDGPYYVIRFVLKSPGVAVLPKLGNPRETTLNLVPSDFVVEAIARLSQHPRAVGQVFHLADPNAMNIEQIVSEIGKRTGKKIVSLRMPFGLTKGLLGSPGLKQLLQIPTATLDYFTHPTRYTTDATAVFLKELGLQVPHFGDYSARLIEFVRVHPDLRSQAMI